MMHKILFFGFPAHGHTNPSLGLVRELVRRGNRVIYYSFPEFRDRITKTGAEYRDSSGDWSGIDQRRLVSRLSFLYSALVECTVSILDRCIEIIEEEAPACVIHDSLAPWAKFAARKTQTLSVSSISTFLFQNKAVELADRLRFLTRIRSVDIAVIRKLSKHIRVLKEKYGITETGFVDILNNTSPLNIIYTLRELQPGGNLFDEENYRFIGPSFVHRKTGKHEPDYRALKKPLIYMAFGTILQNKEDFYISIFERFSTIPCSMVISAGKDADAGKLDKISPGITVLNSVNQIEVLKHADLFITHGGMNSVHESLFYGVPMVILPHHEEQRTVARRCEHLGCGLHVKKGNADTIFRACAGILSDTGFQAKAKEISRLFRNCGGVREAADAIENFIKRIR